jgi:hypothetical protein
VGPTLTIQPALVAAPGTRITVSVPFAQMPAGFSEEDIAVAVEVVDDNQRALQMGGVQTRWHNFPASITGRRMVAELTELDGLRLQFLASR